MTDRREWLRVTGRTTDVQVVQAASECDLYGHEYEVRDVDTVSEPGTRGLPMRWPESVLCSRCGKSWKVER